MADLRDADLFDAHLQGADLAGARLCGAALGRTRLHGADLAGADLSGTTGLTEAQLARASCDSATKLPARLDCDGEPVAAAAE